MEKKTSKSNFSKSKGYRTALVNIEDQGGAKGSLDQISVKKSKTIKNELAFISGATAGIGKDTTEILLDHGYDVILCGRRKERLEEMKKRGKNRVSIFQIDVTQRRQIEKMIDENKNLFKDLSVLINNAGLAKGRDSFQNSKIDDMESMISTNVMGMIYLSRLLIPFLIEKDRGHIVNIGSVAGKWVYPSGAVYCASKFAVAALSEGMRLDLLGKNIRLTQIQPGMVETEFSEVRFDDKDKAKAVYQGMKPLTGKDIAETIHWCLSRPSHVNIQEVVIFPTDQVGITSVHRN